MRLATLIVLGVCSTAADLLMPDLPKATPDALFYGAVALAIHWFLSLAKEQS